MRALISVLSGLGAGLFLNRAVAGDWAAIGWALAGAVPVAALYELLHWSRR